MYIVMLDSTIHGASTALVAAIFSFLVSYAVLPAVTRAGRYWRPLDTPGDRKTHLRTVPLTGGIAVACGVAAGCLAAYGAGAFPASFAPAGGALPFIAATGVVLVLGLFDDVRGCPVGTKLFFQSVAAIMIVGAGQSNGVLSTPFGPFETWGGSLLGVAGAAIAVGWLVGVTNAVNFMDGVDGLASGLTGIMAVTLAVFAALEGDTGAMAVALALAGACVGLLRYNWPPARVFLGDAGSLTIGFVLACLSLNVVLRSGGGVAAFVPILVLGVPTFDALLVMRDRFREDPSRGWWARVRRVGEGDRNHLHHLLLRVTGPRSTVLALYGFVALSCFVALVALLRGDAYLAAGGLAAQVLLLGLGRYVLVRQALAGDNDVSLTIRGTRAVASVVERWVSR